MGGTGGFGAAWGGGGDEGVLAWSAGAGEGDDRGGVGAGESVERGGGCGGGERAERAEDVVTDEGVEPRLVL